MRLGHGGRHEYLLLVLEAQEAVMRLNLASVAIGLEVPLWAEAGTLATVRARFEPPQPDPHGNGGSTPATAFTGAPAAPADAPPTAGRAVSSPAMIRRLFAMLSGVSLLLCALTCVLWAESHSQGYCLNYVAESPQGLVMTSAFAARGGLWVGGVEGAPGPIGWDFERVARLSQMVYAERFPAGTRAGFVYRPRTTRGRMYGIVVPLWVVALAAAAAPAWHVAWVVRVRRRRTRAGLCPACGQDLRDTSGGCSECGFAPTTGAAA